jgi:hypothetical protein
MPGVAQPPSSLQAAIREVLAHPHVRARLLALALVRTPFRSTADDMVRDALARLFEGRAPWDQAGGVDLVEHLGNLVNEVAWDATHDVDAEDGCMGLLEELRRRLRARKDELALTLVDLVEQGIELHADQARVAGAAIDDVALAHRRIGRHVRAMIRGDRETDDQGEGSR